MRERNNTVTIKLNDVEQTRLNHFREKENATITDFVVDAVDEKIEKTKLLRSGGLFLTAPNPEFSGAPHITSEQKLKALQILHQANADLAKEAGFVGSGLSEYAEWLHYHFFEKSEQQQEKFLDNFTKDAKFEESLKEDA